MTEAAHKILDHGELPEGRVTTVTIGHHTLAVTNHEGTYGCLDNHCPHQGGPLGDGEIDVALEEARQMIAAGDRPLSVKHSAAARLAELFGRAA